MTNKPPIWPILLPAFLIALAMSTYLIEDIVEHKPHAPATSIYPQGRPTNE